MLVQAKRRLVFLAVAILTAISPTQLQNTKPIKQVFQPYQAWKTNYREVECLAKNIYFESRGEPFHGKIAVAQVTLNRVNDSVRFAKTICKVVFERKQFSWTNNPRQHITDKTAWQESLVIAQAVLEGTLYIADFPAKYFHARQVSPVWAKSLKPLRTIGNHVFYI
jgi:spore germination cell wall hydrolase CwlJ-like protein